MKLLIDLDIKKTFCGDCRFMFDSSICLLFSCPLSLGYTGLEYVRCNECIMAEKRAARLEEIESAVSDYDINGEE